MVIHAELPVGIVGPSPELTYDYTHLGAGADALEQSAAGHHFLGVSAEGLCGIVAAR